MTIKRREGEKENECLGNVLCFIFFLNKKDLQHSFYTEQVIKSLDKFCSCNYLRMKKDDPTWYYS